MQPEQATEEAMHPLYLLLPTLLTTWLGTTTQLIVRGPLLDLHAYAIHQGTLVDDNYEYPVIVSLKFLATAIVSFGNRTQQCLSIIFSNNRW